MASGDTDNAGVLTVETLKSLSNEFDIESIHTISLSRQDLNDISVISELCFLLSICNLACPCYTGTFERINES